MARLIGFVFSTGGIVISLLAGALWLWRRPRSRAAPRFLLAAASLYIGASIYAVPAIVTRVWTRSYHRLEASEVPKAPTALVVLGAGEDQIFGWRDRFPLTTDQEVERVLEAARVFKLVDPEWVVSSGGGPLGDESAPDSGLVMRDALVRFGVPASRILIESKSRDTHDEAVKVTSMLRSRHVAQVIVVTSTIHMPRSIGAFRAQGWRAVPAIAPDSYEFASWAYWLWPSTHGLMTSGHAAHEITGLPYYWARGWWRR